MARDDSRSIIIDPLTIIAEQPWEAALFTTYALSLSFFEAHLLRNGLNRNGCDEIWLVADQLSYAQALAERQASGAGQDYRIVPVALPHGVFHPKCVYLHSKAFDALLIGSGNLTFGGYGKNVEVIEAFRSDEHPHLFHQFGDFLDALGRRKDFLNPDPLWIERFSNLARAAGGTNAVPQSNLRLAHCVEQSLANQLEALVKAERGCSSIRILSPFFDADAAGVSTLATRAECKNISIGLLPHLLDVSPFPFARRFADYKVAAAQVEVADSNRPLHAKWIEFDLQSGNRLVATGSVNATTQSLCTTKNIEINVLRIEDQSAPKRLKWSKSAAPKSQSMPERIAPGIGSRVILYASLAEGGRLHGTMLSIHEVAGDWNATLMRSDGQSVSFKLSVEGTGSFRVRLIERDAFDLQAGLQLSASKGTIECRCWVNNEWLLDDARMKRAPIGAIERLLLGDGDEDDDEAFIEYLSNSLHEVLPATRSKNIAAADAGPKDAAPTNNSVAVSALTPSEDSPTQAAHSFQTQNGDRMHRLMNRLFGHFERVIQGEAPHKNTSVSAQAVTEEDESDGEDEENEKAQRRQKTQRAFERFRHTVQELLVSQPSEIQRRNLCELWLKVELHYLLRDDSRLDAARAFSREWLIKVTRLVKFIDPPEKLDLYVVSLAAMLGSNAVAGMDQRELLVGLHEALQQFGAASLGAQQMGGLVDHDTWFVGIRVENAPSVTDGLAAILSAPTRRDEVAVLQQALTRKIPLPRSLAILAGRLGENIKQAYFRGETVKLVTWLPGRSACPKCSMTLNDASRQELDRLHLTRCVQCDSYIVNP